MSSDLVKLSYLVGGTPVDALETVLHRSKDSLVGRAFAKPLKEAIPRQQFEIKVQACVGSKVLASETIRAYRKDVTAGLYGGHFERNDSRPCRSAGFRFRTMPSWISSTHVRNAHHDQLLGALKNTSYAYGPIILCYGCCHVTKHQWSTCWTPSTSS